MTEDGNHGAAAGQVDCRVGPVAWAMSRPDGLVLDVICPDEHESHEGRYTRPLYDQAALDAAVAAERERWFEALRTMRRNYEEGSVRNALNDVCFCAVGDGAAYRA